MELSWELLALLFAVALCAGIVDAIAGGGGLITLPVLMMAGLTPAQAIATNKIQALTSVASSAHRYFRAGVISGPGIKAKIFAALMGASVGSTAIQFIDSSLVAKVAPFILIGVAGFFLVAPRLSRARTTALLGEGAFAALIVPVIAFYDGFFGPGTGALYAAAFVAFLSRDLRRATGETKLLNSAGSLISALIFIPGGAVVWSAAIAMVLGGVIGAQIGAHLALRVGPPLIRLCLVVVSVLLALRLLLG